MKAQQQCTEITEPYMCKIVKMTNSAAGSVCVQSNVVMFDHNTDIGF